MNSTRIKDCRVINYNTINTWRDFSWGKTWDYKSILDREFASFNGDTMASVMYYHAAFSHMKDDAPYLTVIHKCALFQFWYGSAPSLKRIGETLRCRNWRGTAPNLQSIGGRKFEWAKFWKP